jgi:hypothetical protein
VVPLLLGGIGEEGSNGGKLTRRRGGPKALRPAVGEKCPKIRGTKPEEPFGTNCLSPIAAQELDQSMSGRCIGAHRVLRTAQIVFEMGVPARGKRGGRMN